VNDLKGKTVLITGGARRLGRASAFAMAQAGAKIAFTYLSSEDAARQTLSEIRELGSDGHAIQCDIRREESIASAIASTVARFGVIDILINNAGTYESVPFDQISVEQWDNMFATNVRGPFLFSRHAIPALRKTQGRIIHMGSLGGEKPWASHAHYCASKAALHMLTQVMAKALAPEIAVNCVAPGMIDAGERKTSEGELQLLTKFAERTPMRKNGTPKDVVDAVMYFATCSKFITGQILTVDGGLGLV
jgi:3-oxoacyl-[acyl-carrier protein] reductase/pteridine reductase